MYDAIIVGSGPAGVSAAYQLRGMKTLILDVGNLPPSPIFPKENIYDLKDDGYDLFDAVIGNDFKGIENLNGDYLCVKLKSPLMRYVCDHVSSSLFPRDKLNGFELTMGYAEGGLANAWGAGLMRYSKRELSRFPINEEELTPFYDALTKHIGITGEKDDLYSYFGSVNGLQVPNKLSPICENFLKRYKKNASKFNKKIFMLVILDLRYFLLH